MIRAVQSLFRMLHRILDGRNARKFDRHLPITEVLSPPHLHAQHLGFGPRSRAYHSAIVLGDVTVASNVWLGPNTLLDGSAAPLCIGEGCAIGACSQLYTHSSIESTLSGGAYPITGKPITVGRRCFISGSCVLLPGTTVADECVVLAGSVLRGNYPARSIVSGSPARVVGRVVFVGDLPTLQFTKTPSSNSTREMQANA